MSYPVAEMLESKHWKDSASFISNAADSELRLSEVVGVHFRFLQDVHVKLKDLFARNVSEAERDFFQIEDSYKRYCRRQWTKVLVNQIGSDKDPYEYLHRFFDPETIREILRLPRHSKEQVDFIIALKATELDCDDELRNMLYRKFGVTTDTPD